MNNYTGQSDFTLLGFFSQSALMAVVIFVAFLMALSGNALLILLMLSDTHLHTPRYFFISQLSLMDMMYISVTVPKMLMDQVLGSHKMSAAACGMQMFLYLSLAGSEFFPLAAMSCDSSVVTVPLIILRSTSPVNFLSRIEFCADQEVVTNHKASWLPKRHPGMSQPGGAITMNFPFCRSREIYHFFCEAPAVTKLSCSDTWLYETLMYVCCVLMLLIPVTVISGSYSSILLTVLRMNSAEGRKKALATCSSHMTVVLLFYGAAVYTYMLPASLHTPEKDMVVSVFYTILTPLLNPLIYSLRNKNVTDAMKNLFCMKSFFQESLK
ncbi:olfactory receptor 2T29-like [Apodemus sylvaticus]|uniref:olfactory receptor 2T29-like n=1 Tax=Apodemus sylvaticus TaxID=10129 RepID=UPI002241927A|nr:olfactory receptor 2T29-like [Apodemus sylvaticus]